MKTHDELRALCQEGIDAWGSLKGENFLGLEIAQGCLEVLDQWSAKRKRLEDELKTERVNNMLTRQALAVIKTHTKSMTALLEELDQKQGEFRS